MKTIKKLILLLMGIVFITSCCDEDMKNQDASIEANQAPAVQLPAKFSLKAANNMFLAIGIDSILYASEPDSLKAEVFETIDMGNGKNVIKASTGKFLSDNLSYDSKIDVIRNKASDWEMFEITKVSENKINIKGTDGRYLSADLSTNSNISAIREKADAWEVFEIIKK